MRKSELGDGAANLFNDDALDLALRIDLKQDAGDAVSHVFGNASQNDVASRLGSDCVGDGEMLEFFFQSGLAEEIAKRRAEIVKILHCGLACLMFGGNVEKSGLAV